MGRNTRSRSSNNAVTSSVSHQKPGNNGGTKAKPAGLKVRRASDSNKIVLDKENAIETSVADIEAKKLKTVVEETKVEEKPKDTGSDNSNVIEWLTADSVEDVGYWKALAERRRQALETALLENKQLHEKSEMDEQEIKHWKKLADKFVMFKMKLQQEFGIDIEDLDE